MRSRFTASSVVSCTRPRSRTSCRSEFYNLTPPEYWELLHAHASAFRMWKVTYMHTLPSHEAVMDWYRGTGMRPYLQALDDAGRKKFEAEVFAQVREEYPTQSDGSIIFPFPRFFFLATR